MHSVQDEPLIVREKWHSAARRFPSHSAMAMKSTTNVQARAACRGSRFPTALRANKRPR